MLLDVAACTGGSSAQEAPPMQEQAQNLSPATDSDERVPWELLPGAFAEQQRSELQEGLLIRYGTTEGSCVVTASVWFPRPSDPGHPMSEASSRPVEIDGRALELIRTKLFDGQEQALDVLFIREKTWLARLVFEGCASDEVDAFLALLRWRSAP
ncbi:MAG: hypothetical protein RBU37_09955 [Myxococcota bacterium]|nr:hypothetical protein [Myxococcota bacterium]